MGSAFRISAQGKLRAKLPPHSCAVVFSGGLQAFDAARRFPRSHSADPDFYYLTGIRIPDAVAVVFSEPQAFAEGSTSTLVFIPDRTEIGLATMGYEYKGKFGAVGEGTAVRPASQWKKFCTEVLAGEAVQRIFTKPVRESDFRKPGDQEYNYLAGKFFAALAPGFAFEPQAQRFYKEILGADSVSMRTLAARVGAWMEYERPDQEDPLLRRLMGIENVDGLRKLQAEIRRMKVDLLQFDGWMAAMRGAKAEEEVHLIQDACQVLTESLQLGASKARPGVPESRLQAIVSYVAQFRGAQLAAPPMVASGKHSAQPNYAAHTALLPLSGPMVFDLAIASGGYHARATRTVPVGGEFDADLRALYTGIAAIHRQSLKNCLPRTRPGSLQQAAATGFDGLDKQLIFSVNALGAKKVLKVTHVTGIGLELEEGEGIPELNPGMVICVETAIYLPDLDGITAKWRGLGIVLRDMVRITPSGNEILTAGLPLEADGVAAAVMAERRLPVD
ncbi:MAG: hypothetical protein RLZZ165_1133 [Bacteroidota bacterium]